MARPPRAKGPRRPRRRWLRFLLVSLALVVAVVGLGVGVSAVWVLTILPRSLPSVASLESFDPSVGTRVYDENDEQITELHVERRIFVPLAQVPKALREAIVATEDARFYSHHGVDPTGIARAVYQNFNCAFSLCHLTQHRDTDIRKVVECSVVVPGCSRRV